MSTTIAPDLLPLHATRSPLPVLAVVNSRASGVRDAEAQRLEVHAALTEAGASAETVSTGALTELRGALERADGRRVILVGGDGALHAVANLGIRLPDLGLIPVGRANNIARALGLPIDVREAARVAVRGTVRPLDALLVETGDRRVIAVEGVSAGFQAAGRARYRAENSGAVAQGAMALVATLAELPHYTTRLSLDDEPAATVDLEQLFLSTLPLFAFGLRVNPLADVGDGVAEAIALRAPTRRRAVRLLLAARTGRHLVFDGVTLRRWRRARLIDPMPLAADGEPLGTTTARLTVLPGALEVATAIEG